MNCSSLITIFTLSFACPLFCIDADIFKEMLTLSTPVEAQENSSKVQISDECIWDATLHCKAHFKAWRIAPKQESESSMHDLQNCLWSTPCAHVVKKAG